MAKTPEEGFEVLLGRLTPSTTESNAAASHRASIDASLRSNHGMTGFFRSGSYGFGTSISGYSDVDYFAVFPASQLHTSSTDSLNAIASTLRTRFPLSGVYVDAPAVVIPFGTMRSERHEIIPVHDIGSTPAGRRMYGMPDRVGGWMQASPDASGAWINAADAKLSNKVKPLTRIAKAWKYYNNVPIRSFYLELRAVQFALTQQTILYRYDMRSLLAFLDAGLSNVSEPEMGNIVYPCYTTELTAVQTAIRIALGWANNARSEEDARRTAQAFNSWDRVFAGQFPGYY
jgi:hypothetical protein